MCATPPGIRSLPLTACRWNDRTSTTGRLLTVREAIYDGVISTPKTDAGRRQIPLSATADHRELSC